MRSIICSVLTSMPSPRHVACQRFEFAQGVGLADFVAPHLERDLAQFASAAAARSGDSMATLY